jgi:hypothetical protein
MSNQAWRAAARRLYQHVRPKVPVPQPILVAAGNVHDYIRRGKVQAGLYAFYDLAVSPPSFDAVPFLIKAEIARREAGHPYVHVVIVPGLRGGFRMRSGHERNDLGAENLWWRLRNIVVPLCWLLPSCRAVTVCASREEALGLWQQSAGSVFPDRYSVSVPLKVNLVVELTQAARRGDVIPSLAATPSARHYVRGWIEREASERRVVSMTLRESSYGPGRNSNINEWAKFARSLDQKIYFPVILRDFERVLDPVPTDLSAFTFFSEPVWNVEIRAALYELCFLNLFVNNGPQILGWFDERIRYISFKMVTESYPSTTEEFIKESVGLVPGGNLPWAGEAQRLVWERDTADVVRREFNAVVTILEENAREKQLG